MVGLVGCTEKCGNSEKLGVDNPPAPIKWVAKCGNLVEVGVTEDRLCLTTSL